MRQNSKYERSRNFSQNNIQLDNEYKINAYTTTSTGDEQTITSTRSNSNNDGTNNTSSSSSDTVRTRNGQTVTVYKDGRKDDTQTSSYERWWSDSNTDKGVTTSTSGSETWSSSYTRREFKGGYSWSETRSGTDTESVTKAGTTTSKQTNWSWSRSGTVWDDGRNNWSESWSKSNWENGRSVPGESETARGSYDPKGTGTQTNNLPKAGDAPRVKTEQLVSIWGGRPNYQPQPTQYFYNELPIAYDPNIADKFSGDFFAAGGNPGGNPDVSKMSFIEKLKAAIQLVPGLLAGDAKAAFQQLLNDPGFWAALIGLGLAFAALQAIPGVGQLIDAMLIIVFGFSAAKNLVSFLLKTWQAKDQQGLRAAANDFKNFVEEVGTLALIVGLKLAGRLLRSIRTGKSGGSVPSPSPTPLPSPAPLRFGSNDLVYGPSAGGRLRQLQERAGGRTLTDAVSDLGGRTWLQASIDTMEEALRNGNKIHFDLTNVEDLSGILNNTGRFASTVTAQELRYIYRNWSRAEVKNSVRFYINDVEVPPPW